MKIVSTGIRIMSTTSTRYATWAINNYTK